MKRQIRNLQESRRLLSSEDRKESVAALALLLATFGPILWQLWQVYQMWGDSSSAKG